MTTKTLRRHASTIFRAALAAADPADAGASMAQAAERVLGRRIAAGLINVKDGHLAKLRRIELHQCGLPVPDELGVAGAERIAQIAAAAGPSDLVICLISGGASALLPLPADG